MPGLEQICAGVYWLPGTMPSDTVREPDIANAFLIERNGRAYLIDTGVGGGFRRMLAQFLAGRSYESFTLINTHWHIDHVCNNDLINGVAARTKQHLIHEAGVPYLDVVAGFQSEMAHTARFYSPLRADEGLLRLSATVVRSLAQVSPSVAYRLAARVMMRKFGVVRSETQYLRPLRVADRVRLQIGAAGFLGWRAGDLMLLDDGGHSPDSIVLYDPDCRLLLLGDLSYEFNPLWASGTYERAVANLKAYRSLVLADQVTILADSHNHKLFRGPAEILPLLDGLIAAHQRRYGAIVQVMEETGLGSVEQLRSALIQRNEEFRRLSEREFPHAYSSTRAMIAVAIQEQRTSTPDATTAPRP